jgi:spore coat polysaccharide biosynthesis protein SpsF (cytidylyltransferase family)
MNYCRRPILNNRSVIRIVIQARMGSSRLYGKIMAQLGGEPLLAHTVRRLNQCGMRSGECGVFASFRTPHSELRTPLIPHPSPLTSHLQLLVATTTRDEDDLTAIWCQAHGIACFRGDADDVLARYVAATADLGDEDVVVRATADNPLYCPERSAAIVAEHLRGRADYTCIDRLSYVVPEVMRVRALRRMAALAGDPYCREHVTPYFRQRPETFNTLSLPADWRGLRPEVRLTVDTQAELSRMQRLVARLRDQGPLFSLEAAYEEWEKMMEYSAAPVTAA